MNTQGDWIKCEQMPKIALVIPLKNECDIAPTLVDRLSTHLVHSRLNTVFFIDDHSTDGTYTYLLEKEEEFAWLSVLRNENLLSGYGSAIAFGINTLRAKDITWAIVADSDLTNSLEEIEKLAEMCIRMTSSNLLGLIKGNRYWDSRIHMTGLPVARKNLSIMANIVSRLFSLNIHPDPTNGFRAVRISTYPRFYSVAGFESIIQELFEFESAHLEIGIFNTNLNYDQDIRGKSSFKFEMSLIFRYISWLSKIGQIRILRKVSCE